MGSGCGWGRVPPAAVVLPYGLMWEWARGLDLKNHTEKATEWQKETDQ